MNLNQNEDPWLKPGAANEQEFRVASMGSRIEARARKIPVWEPIMGPEYGAWIKAKILDGARGRNLGRV